MKRTDANHSEIVAGLRAIGATVRSTADVGHGFPDIAVGHQGLNWFFEIKDGGKSASRRRLTAEERAFHQIWRGQVDVINSLDEAIAIIRRR